MRQDIVMKFFAAVGRDEAVARRLHATDEDIDDFARLSAELGRERGFEFEPSDVKAAIASLMARRQGELADRDLSKISGGGTAVSPPTILGTTFVSSSFRLLLDALAGSGGTAIGTKVPPPPPPIGS